MNENINQNNAGEDSDLEIDNEEFLAALMEPAATRNVHPPVLNAFKASGEVYQIVNDQYPGKTAVQIFAGLKIAAKKDTYKGIEVRKLKVNDKEIVALFNRPLATATA